MNTPAPMTDAEIDSAFEAPASLHPIPANGKSVVFSTLVGLGEALEFARAIESARDAQWLKMLGDGEAVAWVIALPDGDQFVYDERMLNLIDPKIHATRRMLYTHPAPYHTVLLRQALEALEVCNNALYEERSAWDIDPPIAHIVEGISASDAAITALTEALNVQSK